MCFNLHFWTLYSPGFGFWISDWLRASALWGLISDLTVGRRFFFKAFLGLPLSSSTVPKDPFSSGHSQHLWDPAPGRSFLDSPHWHSLVTGATTIFDGFASSHKLMVLWASCSYPFFRQFTNVLDDHPCDHHVGLAYMIRGPVATPTAIWSRDLWSRPPPNGMGGVRGRLSGPPPPPHHRGEGSIYSIHCIYNIHHIHNIHNKPLLLHYIHYIHHHKPPPPHHRGRGLYTIYIYCIYLFVAYTVYTIYTIYTLNTIIYIYIYTYIHHIPYVHSTVVYYIDPSP